MPSSQRWTGCVCKGLKNPLRSAGRPNAWETIELEYRVDLPVDQYVPPPPVAAELAPAPLKLVPGYDATVLPLPADEMPTGLAWRPDGTLVLSSLKGRVLLARDTNGDRLEDKFIPFSDDLAAPYGVACDGDAVDVINKYGLLRLSGRGQPNHDGQATEIAHVLASGWGYTADYHDWAVGLPRDREGNYYVALPCQQDDRSQAAAYLRGMTLKLKPREATSGEPRLFTIEPIAAGLRFPMGLALNRLGDLFCSDNQGNYTPFNELNHLVAGKRYGFINKLEVKPGFSPPFQPAAVDIPHPWARSINGICFLDTPDAVRMKTGSDLFGPFEGQVLACEYTTLQLLRMSLEKIGDTYQGAVYPLSREPNAGEATFEGPICCAIAPDGDVYVGNLRDSLLGLAWAVQHRLRSSACGPRACRCGLAEGASPIATDLRYTSLSRSWPTKHARRRTTTWYRSVASRRRLTAARTSMSSRPRFERSKILPIAGRCDWQLDALARPGFVYEFPVARLPQLAPGQAVVPGRSVLHAPAGTD